MMNAHHYLVFGDLHGRILPAFRLALRWSRAHEMRLDGLLQVGDLGYFPDSTRLDKATKRHAQDDPLELGASDLVQPSEEADAIFLADDAPTMWFIAGNHEDYDALEERQTHVHPRVPDFPVDCYGKVRCIRDGATVQLPGGLRVGGLWGVDDQAPFARKKVPPRGYIRPRSAAALSASEFDVLLSHDAPRDGVYVGAGSEPISEILILAEPAFAFFGHYSGVGHRLDGDFGKTAVYHLAGFELREHGGGAEPGSVGLLTCSDARREFTYLDEDWLRSFTRHNMRHQ